MKELVITSEIKIEYSVILLFLMMLLPGSHAISQDKEWTHEISEDEKTSVQSRVYYDKDENGEERKIIEYSARTVASVSLQNCEAVMKDASLHKVFFNNTEVSDKISDLSENDFLIYYFYDAPWPLPNSDCVSRIRIMTDSIEKKVTVSSTAEPNSFEDKDVARAKLNNFTFIFRELNNEDVEITLNSTFSPVILAPKWMIHAWFPEGPHKILELIINLADTIK